MQNNSIGYTANLLVLVAFLVKLLNLHLNVTPQEIVDAISAGVILIGSIVSIAIHIKQGNLTVFGSKKQQ